jgi:MarR family transcriptional regulator, lower aerobic nicotinate degradation pathway regulator
MTTLQRVAGRPTWLLGRANARAQALLADAFASAGMRGYHFRLLAALEEHGPASQADLSRSTGIDTSDVVAAVNHLLASRYVRRQPDAADRRRKVVSITKPGLAAVERVGRAVDRVQDAVMEPLTASERTTFLRLLAQLT